jgi:hypothetical protein
LLGARLRGDDIAVATICRRLDDAFVSRAFRRLDDREIRRLRRALRPRTTTREHEVEAWRDTWRHVADSGLQSTTTDAVIKSAVALLEREEGE